MPGELHYLCNTFVVLFRGKTAAERRTYTIPAGNLSFHVSGGDCPGGMRWRFSTRRGEGDMINCAGFLERSAVNGPGRRAVVWVQGCPLRCPGCFNRDLWSFRKANFVHEEMLAERILSIPGIEGVSFSGGEPFCQAAPLATLGKIIRDAGRSVVTFSGYPIENLLRSRRQDWRALLQETDLLVAGPYLQELRMESSLCASSNQVAAFLSGRITPYQEEADKGESVEFTICRDGEITTTGFPKRAPLPFERGCT